jgi:hypothetical protein
LELNFPDTREGDNWTVVVFRCQKQSWVETLARFFSHLESSEECLIPHYTIRTYNPTTDCLTISLRILRRRENEENVISLARGFLKDRLDSQIDPREDNPFYPFHEWIKHTERNDDWIRERCEVLNRLSKVALTVINSDSTMQDRVSWAHLFSNMIAVFDKAKIVVSPETVLRNIHPTQTGSAFEALFYG